jgi:hypothetical protein
MGFASREMGISIASKAYELQSLLLNFDTVEVFRGRCC